MTLIAAAERLRHTTRKLVFAEPVHTVYHPMDYAWDLHKQWLEQAQVGVPAVLLGMNPGPWGMAQTGVPFGEVAAVRDWLKLDGKVCSPKNQHPKRPIEGLACQRSEVSGKRLWDWAKDRFATPKYFFRSFFILNWCPLAFMEEGGRNRTPDKLPLAERTPLAKACDQHLREAVAALKPGMVIGVGGFARKQAERALADVDIPFGTILHPSPASPAANRGWAPQVDRQLQELGLLASR